MNPGPRWVNSYFVPNLRRLGIADRPLRILSLWPDDASEAEELGRLGHACELAEFMPDSPSPWSDHTFDIVITGRLPKLAISTSERDRTIRMIYSALRPGGGLLVAIGNRLCPVDLSRNAPLLHGPFNRHCMSWREVKRLFLSPSGPFQAVKPLPVEGHFGWHRLGSLNFLGRLLEAYWKSVVTPRRLSLYTSPLNPIFMLWIQK
jgi:SAM-dependent methyltransferase